MTSPPVTSSVEHWSFQVDSPFRGPAEIRELAAGGSRPAAVDVGLADEGVFGEDLAQAEEEFEAYDELEPSSEADAYDEAELAEASQLEEAPASEHPLAAVFSLPRLAFDAMAKGGWATAIAIAIGAGLRDINQLTNMVFWFRHPQMIGQKLRADQRDLAREWLQIRDQVVKPALASGVPTAPAAPSGPSTPAPTAVGKRTSIPSDGLRWFGPASEETPELMAFMRKVYDLHVKRSKGDFVDTLPDGALDDVEPYKKARKDAAAKAREMLKAARAKLEADGLTDTVRIGVLSAYRSADHQFDIWQGKTTKGKGGFPHYYAQTKATRRNPRYGGEHSDKAAAYLAEYMANCVAAPGYSNHQDGLALDLGTRKGKGRLIKLYKGSWFHDWLRMNASTYHFEPLPSEAWHWTYRPPPGGSEAEAWSSEVTPTAVTAGRLEVTQIPLLASHRGRAPDLVLRWNDMPTVPAEIDVVVHLHGYSRAAMTLPKHMEVWAGLDLGPVDGASGTGRTRPTLTVLPRGHFTGVQVGKIYRYTFPALTTKDGLTTLVRVALENFSQRVGGLPPKLGRLILTAHSGGGAPLMQILRRHDPQEVHVFDGLYQDATPLADWASRHIKADRLAVQGGAAPTSAMRVFFGPTTRGFSLRLHRALAADLQDAPASIGDRYRVESSRLGHWQIARQYGWRMLADAAANVPDAVRPAPPKRSVKRLFEVDAAEMPFLSEAPFPEAVEATEADEAEAWELGESDTEGEAEFDEFESDATEADEAEAWELEEVSTEAETDGRAFESAYDETDPEFEDSEAAVDAVFGAPGAEAEAAFEEPEAEDLAGEEPEERVDPADGPAWGGTIWTFRAQAPAGRVAVFCPRAALGRSEVDVLLFAHGLPAGCPELKRSLIPAGFVTHRPFQLGQPVAASGRPIVLVVPELNWSAPGGERFFGKRRSRWHALGDPRALNALVAQALTEIGRVQGATPPTLQNLLIAGHSRAHSLLEPLAHSRRDPAMSQGALARLRRIFAFDTTYDGDVKAWLDWLTLDPQLQVDVFYREARLTKTVGKRFYDARRPRLNVTRVKEKHCEVPARRLPGLLGVGSPASEELPEELPEAAPTGSWTASDATGEFALTADDKKLLASQTREQRAKDRADFDKSVRRRLAVLQKAKSRGALHEGEEKELADLRALKERVETAQRALRRKDVEEVLEAAGQTTAGWFGDIQKGTFLGIPLRVHRTLAERLTRAQTALVGDREVNPAGLDAAALGKRLKMYASTSGLRKPALAVGGTSLSLHTFGLAVDLNYRGNPFIGNASELAPAVVRRATSLVNGTAIDVLTRLGGPKAAYATLKTASDALKTYFSYRHPTRLPKLTEKLAGRTPGKGEPVDVPSWLERIKKDHAALRAGGDFANHKPPEEGFLDLDKAVVLALTGAGLKWGGTYPRAKDIMHFDLRRAEGAKVHAARTAHNAHR